MRIGQRIALDGARRRIGTVVEDRLSLDDGKSVREHRLLLEDGGCVWVDLETEPHEMLEAAVDDECIIQLPKERIGLRCIISHARLIDPARGEKCAHPANANFKVLLDCTRRQRTCPLFGCNQPIMRGQRSIVRDDELAMQLRGVPSHVETAWLSNGELTWMCDEEEEDDGAAGAVFVESHRACRKQRRAHNSERGRGSRPRFTTTAGGSGTAEIECVVCEDNEDGDEDNNEDGDEDRAEGNGDNNEEEGAAAFVLEAEGLTLHISRNRWNVTGYKGVSKKPSRYFRPYHAVAPGGKSLGWFKTAVEAAVVYARHCSMGLNRTWVQCDACDKWRRLPAGEAAGRGRWECRLHPDPGLRSCAAPEEALDGDEEDGAAVDDDDGGDELLSAENATSARATYAAGMRLVIDVGSETGYKGVSRATGAGDGIVRYRAQAPKRPSGGWHPGVHGPRRVRCRQCNACRLPPCGVCAPCLDCPRFGGPGRQKQSCRQRVCLDPLLPAVLPEGMEHRTCAPRMVGQDLGTYGTAIEAAIAYARFVQGVEVVNWVQCDDCAKWRRVPEGAGPHASSRRRWTCRMLPQPGRGCGEPEEAMEESEQLQFEEAGPTPQERSAGLRSWACCDLCSKWRRLPLGVKPPGKRDSWDCSMVRLACSVPEAAMREDEDELLHPRLAVTGSRRTLREALAGVPPSEQSECPELGEGWMRVKKPRHMSVEGRIAHYSVYYSPQGEIFRSMVEAQRHLAGRAAEERGAVGAATLNGQHARSSAVSDYQFGIEELATAADVVPDELSLGPPTLFGPPAMATTGAVCAEGGDLGAHASPPRCLACHGQHRPHTCGRVRRKLPPHSTSTAAPLTSPHAPPRSAPRPRQPSPPSALPTLPALSAPPPPREAVEAATVRGVTASVVAERHRRLTEERSNLLARVMLLDKEIAELDDLTAAPPTTSEPAQPTHSTTPTTPAPPMPSLASVPAPSQRQAVVKRQCPPALPAPPLPPAMLPQTLEEALRLLAETPRTRIYPRVGQRFVGTPLCRGVPFIEDYAIGIVIHAPDHSQSLDEHYHCRLLWRDPNEDGAAIQARSFRCSTVYANSFYMVGGGAPPKPYSRADFEMLESENSIAELKEAGFAFYSHDGHWEHARPGRDRVRCKAR